MVLAKNGRDGSDTNIHSARLEGYEGKIHLKMVRKAKGS